MRVVSVHGACVRDGSWWWGRTARLLEERGVRSFAPALPSCGESGATAGPTGPGFAEDVASVRRVLLDSNEETVVVAHSYGGIVVAEAAAGVASVRHILLISSYLPEIGQRLADFGAEGPSPFLDVDLEAGTFGVRPEVFADAYLQDCDAEVQEEGARHLARQGIQVLGHPVSAAAWHDVPTTYLVCAADGGTAADLQREYARRAGRVVEIDAGHHPFLSQPGVVADLVMQLEG